MLIRYECTLNAQVKHPFVIQSAIKRGTKPIIRYSTGFVLNLGLLLAVSLMGNGMVFLSRFSSTDLDANKLVSIYVRYFFSIFLTRGSVVS